MMNTESTFLVRNARASPALVQGSPRGDGQRLRKPLHSGKLSSAGRSSGGCWLGNTAGGDQDFFNYFVSGCHSCAAFFKICHFYSGGWTFI